MSVVQGEQGWWPIQADEIPGRFSFSFRGAPLGFLSSLCIHVALLVGLGLMPVVTQQVTPQLAITAPVVEEVEPVQELTVAKDFAISDQPLPEIGALSEGGTGMALSVAPTVSTIAEISDVPHPVDTPIVSVGQAVVHNEIQIATGLRVENVAVRGHAGEGTTGAVGAVDRITKDILLSLEERRTLVVWFFDQSGSLTSQRKQIYDRFDRIYEELGVIESSGNPAFKKYDDKPLLTSIVSFGSNVKFVTEKPTDNLADIKAAIASIEQDTTGIEKTFSALYMAAERFRKFRQDDPIRNIVFVMFTDEVGNDQEYVEKTVNICRRLEIPVYVVGIPAPFGKLQAEVKYIDPDPKYDQTPIMIGVDQGPESLLPEVVHLPFVNGESPNPMDSGFGPYALTRLCYETGGVYFTVHPNRNVNRQVGRGEVQDYTAYLKYFFDVDAMRKYRPDYVSREEYLRRVSKSRMRSALVRAAEVSGVGQLETPNRRFVKSDEAAFSNALTEAQKAAAVLEPRLNALYEILRVGEAERAKEVEPRWQANFDLSMGRVLAAKVRAEGFNSMLAAAKRGLKFTDSKDNTWVLESAEEITTGSQMAKAAQQSKMYLEKVVSENPKTPWEMLAKLELKTPLGWRWKEEFTDLTPRVAAKPNNNNNNNTPAKPRPAAVPQTPPKRSPPKL